MRGTCETLVPAKVEILLYVQNDKVMQIVSIVILSERKDLLLKEYELFGLTWYNIEQDMYRVMREG
ncbi:MAG: hypothetical protein JXQ96_11650 [Cyclobacteriaceae bacterium]